MSAAWTAESLLELARSYQSACVLAAAADLEIFEVLRGRGRTAAEAARAVDADPRALTVLLNALTALGLLQKQDDTFTVPDEVRPLVAARGPGSVLRMLQHQANCLRRWVQLTDVVKTGQAAARVPSCRGAEADYAAFIGAMDNICAPVADEVVADLGVLEFSHVLDLGGASGTWTAALLRRYPQARATLFDLPEVIPAARRRMSEAGLAGRVEFAAGDFYVDPLPVGADLVWISAIVHQSSREQNRRLLSAVAVALTTGGQVVIRDVLMEDSHAAPRQGALFAVNMLVATEAGGTFSLRELREDLKAAGFEQVSVLRADEGMNSVIRAVKAS